MFKLNVIISHISYSNQLPLSTKIVNKKIVTLCILWISSSMADSRSNQLIPLCLYSSARKR